jgi:protein-S-isoprenylcysteine O-methyltransferase Ste14
MLLAHAGPAFPVFPRRPSPGTIAAALAATLRCERTCMANAVFTLGAAAAIALLALLMVTLFRGALRIWPTPGPKTWQSYVFWPLFRGLNVLCFAAAAADRTPFLGLPAWLRGIAATGLVISLCVFLYAFRLLGRDNSYGAQDGLVTGGIYQWSRNPQNAMLMLVYGFLALAADSASAYVLCAAMVAVYYLMVLAEEPWLAEAYGEPYARYCREVPRFFNWRRVVAMGADASGPPGT